MLKNLIFYTSMKKILLALLLLSFFVNAKIIGEVKFDSINYVQTIDLPFSNPLVHIPQIVNSQEPRCIYHKTEPLTNTLTRVHFTYNPLCQFIGKFIVKATNPADSRTKDDPHQYIFSFPTKADI